MASSLSWRTQDLVLCSIICSTINYFYYDSRNYRTACDTNSSKLCNKSKKTYDFVIIGYGTSGKSAAQTLQTLCPKASIAILDPINTIKDANLEYYNIAVTAVNPDYKEIVGVTSKDYKEIKVNYKHSMLISTGSRCAPIPNNLIDRGALDRVIELFPTTKAGLSPEAVHGITRMASEQGASVCILGSGIEALFLALSCANASKKHSSSNKVKMLFGDSSPLSRMLPSYLSIQISHRLRKIGIDVQERTLVRYVMPSFTPENNAIEIHTVKSYDSFLTERLSADLLVAAPSSLLPHQTTASILKNKPWSQIISTSTKNNIISCFSSDSRILVNPQLNITSNMYAAGSCASYPDSGSTVVPLSLYSAVLSGRIAATNMAQQYYNNNKHQLMCNHTNPPIWSTSDILSKLNSQDTFSSSGIQAVSIGECNSHTMSIHSFWWTNHAIRKRQTNRANNKSSTFYPVYGIGLLYYVDQTGQLKGILCWGMNPNLVLQNEDIVLRLKTTLQTNGQNINNDLTLHELCNESQTIIQNLLSKDDLSMHVLYPTTKDVIKPFYRYTPAKNSVRRYVTSSIGFKKLVANDLENGNFSFVADTNTKPFVLPRSFQSIEGNTVTPLQNKIEMNYARPNKEDAIWMYQGEEDRFVSSEQKQMDMFLNNMRKGLFSDGSDPLS